MLLRFENRSYSKHQKNDGTISIFIILILFICRYIDYQVKQLHNENYLAVSDGSQLSLPG